MFTTLSRCIQRGITTTSHSYSEHSSTNGYNFGKYSLILIDIWGLRCEYVYNYESFPSSSVTYLYEMRCLVCCCFTVTLGQITD